MIKFISEELYEGGKRLFKTTDRVISNQLDNNGRTLVNVVLDVFLPETYHIPTHGAQFAVISLVASHVFFDFLNPVLAIAFEPLLALFPVFSVPKLTINEDGDVIFSNCNIRGSRQLFVVATIPNTTMP